MNLWEETIDDLKHHDKSWNDVIWVGTSRTEISKDTFEALAKKTNYDEGYGWQEVATNLIIVGNNWFMQRDEYDGAERWIFRTMFSRPKKKVNVSHLSIHPGHSGWETLEELNNIE